MRQTALAQEINAPRQLPPKGRSGWLVAAGLALLTAVVFSPALRAQFINFDDFAYVTENPLVQGGLSVKSLIEASLSRTLALYHPLAVISLMIDHAFFGMQPAGYHAVNVVIHILSVMSLFGFLRSATGSPWRSALAAAIFAVHPLRVESVLWVAERKDVLSVFFGLLTLRLYVWHARRPSGVRALALAPLFALSLLAKPMLVTLPAVMLLLDYWPLRRLRWSPRNAPGEPVTFPVKSTLFLLAEKLPLLALCAGSVFLTISDARLERDQMLSAPPGDQAAIPQFDPTSADYTLFQDTHWRLRNIPVSYVRYLGKMVDFRGLAPFYPTARWPTWQVAGAALLLSAITLGALSQLRRRPWIVVGWLWYLGTLAPVIGFFVVSAYSLADRYTYFPMIGILLAAVWSLPERWAIESRSRRALTGASAVALLILSTASFVQATHWRDSQTLWRHTVSVTGDNWLAYDLLGSAIVADHRVGDYPEALDALHQAERLEPHADHPWFMQAILLTQLDRKPEAVDAYEEVMRRNPQNAVAADFLAILLNERGDYAQALHWADRAVSLEPAFVARNHLTRAVALTGLSRWRDALEECRSILTYNGHSSPTQNQLGLIYLKLGRRSEAMTWFRRAIDSDPKNAEARANLKIATEEAVSSPAGP